MSRKGFFIAVAALAGGLAVAPVMLANEVRTAGAIDIALVLAIGWAFVIGGVTASQLRPDNPMGLVMIVTGFLRLGAAFSWSQDPLLYSIGRSLTPAYLVGIGYMLLAFPGGRLVSRLERVLFGILVVAGGPLHVAWLVFGGAGDHGVCPGCPHYVFELVDLGPIGLTFMIAHEFLGIGVGIIMIAILVRRWRLASPALRFAIAPILWVGAAAWVVALIWIVTALLGDPLGRTPQRAMELTVALVAIAFLVGVARTRLARMAVADLVMELADSCAAGELQGAFRRALHDPSLTIAYWLPDEERYVDSSGKALQVDAQEGQVVTMIEKDGHRMAALVHDSATLDDEHLVKSLTAAAALQLENERLQAELRAQLQEVEGSRARIVEAAQEERRRIERDLHDGTQQRLVSIAMTLGLAQSKLSSDPSEAGALVKEAKRDLSDALQELRDLSQGIHPGILTERGLPAALGELVQRVRMPIVLDVSLDSRLPERVEEAAYYFVSEALTNIVKYAHASKGHVQVERWNGVAKIRVSDDGLGGAETKRGSGLRGLRDRIEALGGELIVESPPKGGTLVEADIPCA